MLSIFFLINPKNYPLCHVTAMFSNVVVSKNSHGTGVLEMRKGHTEQARAFFQTAASLGPGMFEAHYNFARYQYIYPITV
jgi:hypothetical protein